MNAIFRPSANFWMKLALLGAGGFVLGGTGWWWLAPRIDWARGVGFTVQQTVPFSHQHHVAGLGIGCQTCHSYVEMGANTGLPPTHTCMACHSQIWTNADVLAPVRQSLAEDKPLRWQRVNNVPDYACFNHFIHPASACMGRTRAGRGCSTASVESPRCCTGSTC